MTVPSPRPTAAPLTGALGTVALADVLQLLDLGRKTGVLAVDAGDGRRGLVRLRDGCVTGARYRDARRHAEPAVDDACEAVAALLALSAGRFVFTTEAPTGPPAAGLRVEALLMDALRRLDERAGAAAPAATDPDPGDGPPSDAAVPPRVPVLAAATDGRPAPVLRAVHWAVLAAVDGVRDTPAIAAACGREMSAVAQALEELAEAGLVAFAEPVAGGAAVATGPARSSAR